MSDRRSEIIVIDAIDPPPLKRALRRRRPSRWPGRCVGLAPTIVLHLLVCSPLLLGNAAHKKKHTPDGIGTTAWASHGERPDAMILLDLSSVSMGPEMEIPKLELADTAIELKQEQLHLVSSFPIPNVPIEEPAEESDQTTEAAGDPRGKAEMFGKYMGQVTARIDRAWTRPRSPLAGSHFQCRARVVQNRQGFVLAVNLNGCGGDAKWRDSLADAILRASPLSAPAEPWLFTETLTLTFAAEQYEQGRTPDYMYEPATAQLAMQPPERPVPAIPESDIVDLTNVGSRIEWKKR